jgi:thiamine-monophosphate kinase
VIAKSGLASAMMDISDGLSSDLLHICDASNVGIELRVADLPISDKVREFSMASGVPPYHYALIGGDDYGLLLTAPENGSEKLIRMVKEKTGTVLTVIGSIVESEKTRVLILSNGDRADLYAEGWQHFGVRR